MTKLAETIDDATRSRLAVLIRKQGGGTMTLYTVRDRFNLVVLVVATCSENALELIREMGLADWTLANTSTQRVQKNIDAEPGVITAFRIAHPHKNSGGRP